METRNCQNCKKDFVIEPEDFGFYAKIQVPPPTFCPECRAIRRMIWRNERSLYKRTCSLCSKNIVSLYPENAKFPVYCQACWWSDAWDPLEYGRNYDFSKDFFTQWKELFDSVPQIALFNANAVNSDYCNYYGGAKNCYLATAGRESENLFYTNRIGFSRDTADCYTGNKLELCYENILSNNCYRLTHSICCEACTDSDFMYDCRNCSNCFGCTNLRNAEHCLWNEQFSKEEYKQRREEIDLGSANVIIKVKERFANLYYASIHRYARLVNCINSTGDNLYNANQCQNCFDILGTGSESCKYCTFIVSGTKDCYDVYGAPQAELLYEALAIGFDSNENSMNLFSLFIRGSSFIYYSQNCHSSQNLFGCLGLKKKEYCIFNKPYTKSEYESLMPKIIQHMNSEPYVDSVGNKYRYGEFFPTDLSPFAYNESIAQEYFTLSEEEAVLRGYRFIKPEARQHQVTVPSSSLADNIRDVDDMILSAVIGCEHGGNCNDQCTSAFKITPSELAFYRKLNLSLPRLCPNCRHYERLHKRNPFQLWSRSCMCSGNPELYKNTVDHAHASTPCSAVFFTPYAPDRRETVYCESCYLNEIS